MKNLLWYADFKEKGYLAIFQEGTLKEWRGQIIRKRRGKVSLKPLEISRYFKGYRGKFYITDTPDRGKTLNFVGTGMLRLPVGKETI